MAQMSSVRASPPFDPSALPCVPSPPPSSLLHITRRNRGISPLLFHPRSAYTHTNTKKEEARGNSPLLSLDFAVRALPPASLLHQKPPRRGGGRRRYPPIADRDCGGTRCRSTRKRGGGREAHQKDGTHHRLLFLDFAAAATDLSLARLPL